MDGVCFRARAHSAGAAASAEKTSEAVWEGVKGNSPRTAAAEAAAATTAAAAAVVLAPVPAQAPAPEGGGRRLSMSTWDEADLTPPLPADVSVRG